MLYISGLYGIFHIFTTVLFAGKSASSILQRQSTSDQHNHKEVFGTASHIAVQPISPSGKNYPPVGTVAHWPGLCDWGTSAPPRSREQISQQPIRLLLSLFWAWGRFTTCILRFRITDTILPFGTPTSTAEEHCCSSSFEMNCTRL